MYPGFDSRTRCHKWVEFVGSLLCSERFFSGYSGFPLSPKTNIWFDLVRFENCKQFRIVKLIIVRRIWSYSHVNLRLHVISNKLLLNYYCQDLLFLNNFLFFFEKQILSHWVTICCNGQLNPFDELFSALQSTSGYTLLFASLNLFSAAACFTFAALTMACASWKKQLVGHHDQVISIKLRQFYLCTPDYGIHEFNESQFIIQ